MLALAWVCLLLTAVAVAHATIYYVDQTNPAASDSNPGTEAAPWLTIGQAARSLHPGDEVIVKQGVYRETVRPARSGEPERPIIYRVAPEQTVVVKGSYPVSDWRRDGSIWRNADWRRRLPQDDDIGRKVLLIALKDGAMGEAVVVFPVKTREALQPGSFYCDPQSQELFLWPESECDPNLEAPEVAVRPDVFASDQSYLEVRGFQFRHATVRDVALSGAGNVIEGNTMAWSGFVGLDIGGRNSVLRGNVLSYNGDTGLGGRGNAHLIESNTVTYNNQRRFDAHWEAGGAKLVGDWPDEKGKRRGGINHSTVRNNEFAYNIGPGLWLDWENNDNIVEGNRCHDNEGPGIMIECSRRNLLRNNLCYRNQDVLAGYFLDWLHDDRSLHWEDFPVALHESSRLEGAGIFIYSAPDTKVFSNTCYGNDGAGIDVRGGDRQRLEDPAEVKLWAEQGPLDTSHIVVMNNLLMNNQRAQLLLRRNMANGVDRSGNISDYNLFFSSTGVPAAVTAGSRPQVGGSLEDWQKATGQDLHSVGGGADFPARGGGGLPPGAGQRGFGQGEDTARGADGYPRIPASRGPHRHWGISVLAVNSRNQALSEASKGA